MHEKRVFRIRNKHHISAKSLYSAPSRTPRLEAFWQIVAFPRTQKNVFFLKKDLRIENIIPANTGVILYGTPGVYSFAEAVTGKVTNDNDLTGWITDTDIAGCSDVSYYALNVSEDGEVGFFAPKGAKHLIADSPGTGDTYGMNSNEGDREEDLSNGHRGGFGDGGWDGDE